METKKIIETLELLYQLCKANQYGGLVNTEDLKVEIKLNIEMLKKGLHPDKELK